MKYEELILKSISKKLHKTLPLNLEKNESNEILMQFASTEFNKASQLPKHLFLKNDENVNQLSEVLKDLPLQKKILLAFSEFIDMYSNKGKFWYVIPSDLIYVSPNYKFAFNWFEIDKFCVSDKKIIDREIKQKYSHLFPRKLNSGIIDFNYLDKNLTIEAFFLFFIHTIFPNIPNKNQLPLSKWINISLTKFNITPEEKYFLIETARNLNSFSNCKEIVTKFYQGKEVSIMTPVRTENMVWNFGFHTEQGRQKRSVQNEDSYEIIQSKNKKSLLFMVADGVSTADIGRGKIVSSRIQEFLRDDEQKILSFLDDISSYNNRDWMVSARSKIEELILKINEDNLEEVNYKLNDYHKSDFLPMSSTLILGMIDKNRVIYGHLGDSHVFYICNNKLMRLNEEHNELSERMSEYIDSNSIQKFEELPSDKNLTRVIPFCEYDDKQRIFIKLNLKDKITFFEFYPQKDAHIIVATDGLIDSLAKTNDEYENEKEILNTFNIALTKSDKPKDIAREMGRMADNNSGIDNITLVILSNSIEQNMKKQFKKLN